MSSALDYKWRFTFINVLLKVVAIIEIVNTALRKGEYSIKDCFERINY